MYIPQIEKILSSIIIKDIFDILIISICIYFILIFIKQTRSFFVLISFTSIFVLDFIAKRLDLTLTRQLFEPLLTLFIAILVIVFQQEIKNFFKWISSGRLNSFSKSLVVPRNNIQTIVRAVFTMAEQRVGSIIVFPGEYPLDDMIEGGFPLNAKISSAIIQSIFDSSSPGHDGAILIDKGEIKMFGLHLPLANEFTEYRRVGTRHRAAAGITENTDALAIVVSEERGEVSISSKGVLTKIKTAEELEVIISKFIGEESKNKNTNQTRNIFNKIFVKNIAFKSSAIVLASVLWYFSVYKTGIVKVEYSIPIEYRFINTDLIIKSSVPDSIDITVTGNNRDITNLKTENIKVIVDASKFKAGVNTHIIKEDNIQKPSYIDISDFKNKTVRTTTEEKNKTE